MPIHVLFGLNLYQRDVSNVLSTILSTVQYKASFSFDFYKYSPNGKFVDVTESWAHQFLLLEE